MAALKTKLDEAVARAERAGFDLPCTITIERVTALLDVLAAAAIDPAALDVSVAVDGAIAVSASNSAFSATVEFDPVSAKTELVISDERERKLLRTAKEPSDLEIVRELERAA